MLLHSNLRNSDSPSRLSLILFSFVAVMLLSACEGGIVDDSFDDTLDGAVDESLESSFVWDECPFEVFDDEDIDCGYLIVPEDRSDPDTSEIELAVAIVRSPNPAPDPIIYLAGGPGGSALTEVDAWLDTPLLDRHDIVLLDQRGTGYSYPSLNCYEVEDLDYEDEVSKQDELDAAADCADRLESEGVVLAAYNSAESAADVEDLRLALGYEEWNLLGISYGTRLALTIMRDYPAGVRSVILDSTYPPHVQAYNEEAVNGAQAFQVLFDGCAADAACNEAYPNLQALFLEVVSILNTNPVDVTVTDPETGELFDTFLSGDDLVDTLFASLYDTEVIPYLPYIIYETSNGNYNALSDLTLGFLPDDDLSDDDFFSADSPGTTIFEDILGALLGEEDVYDSEGAFYAVECREEIPFNSLDETRIAAQAIPPEIHDSLVLGVELLFDTCDVWGIQQADSIENEPVRSDILTIVMAGQYDPVTPPQWGESTAQFLSNSYYFVYPGVGHAAMDGGDCPLGMMVSFVNNPTQSPDASCVAQMSGPDFYIGP